MNGWTLNETRYVERLLKLKLTSDHMWNLYRWFIAKYVGIDPLRKVPDSLKHALSLQDQVQDKNGVLLPHLS